jgi:hypothetical protein
MDGADRLAPPVATGPVLRIAGSGWPTYLLVVDARPNPGRWVEMPAIRAIVARQQRG